MARAALAVSGVALILVGGAALTWGQFDEGHGRSTDLKGISAVRIDNGSGHVEVRRQPGSGARLLEREHHGWGGRWWGDRGPDHSVEGGTLVLDPDCGWNCSVDYELTLPDAVPITGELGSGALEATGMAAVDVELGSGQAHIARVGGTVDVRSGSGDVELSELGGAVRVRTSSGDVEGRELRGQDIDAHTGSGALRLGLEDPRTVRAESGSGEIELTVPDDTYRVSVDTGSGEESVGVRQDPAADRRLELTSGSGDIEVTTR